MSNEELEKTLRALESVTRDITSSPEKARAFLVEMGVVTPDGQLTEHYRQNA